MALSVALSFPACSSAQIAQPTEAASSRPSSLPDAPTPAADSEANDATVAGLPHRIVADEIHAARSPAGLRKADLLWFVPLTAAAAASFATDEKTMSQVVSTNPSFNQDALNVSNSLVGGTIAVPAALFGIGVVRHDDHAREVGVLGGEAMVDSFVLGEVVKLCTFRERPTADNSEGKFYVGSAGADSSFISEHSLVAWSSAAVIASEYRSPWVGAAMYSAAAGVSVTRVLGREHFPSDVLLGSTAGWLIGKAVYRAHHHIHAGMR